MGSFCSNVFDAMSSKKEHRVLFMGLDFAGKTTVLYKLKLGKVVTTIPTIGYNVEEITHNNLTFTCWDVGGRDIGPLWRHYYQNTEAIIFCIDSSDKERICDDGINTSSNKDNTSAHNTNGFNSNVKETIHRVMLEPELEGAVLLIFANKQDLPNAMSVAELTQKLELNKINNHKWHIQGSCATTGEGLYEGLDWLEKAVAGKRKSK